MALVEDYTTGRARGARRGGGQNGRWWIAIVAFGLVIGALTLIGGGGGSKRAATPPATAPSIDQAIATATAFDQRLQRVDDADEAAASDALLAMSTPQYEDELQDRLDALYERLNSTPIATAASDGDAVYARSVPVTHKVKKIDGKRVQVVIWSVSLAGVERVVSPRASWMRNAVSLEQAEGEWRVSGYEELTPLVPTALAQDQPTVERSFWKAQEGAEFYEVQP